MDDSVFTKIIKGEIPGEMIYQDEACVVLLTIEPFTPGHCLVVPRKQVDHLWDTDDELYQHLMSVAKKVANAMRKAYDYPRIGQIVKVLVCRMHIYTYLVYYSRLSRLLLSMWLISEWQQQKNCILKVISCGVRSLDNDCCGR